MKMTRLSNTGNGGAVLSPDGKYIAYMMNGTATDGLWVKQTATDSAIQLLPAVTCWGVTFSRDSNYLYYALGGKDHPDGALYKMAVLGGPPKLVLEGINGGVVFSPDGYRMAFKRNGKELGKPMLITANVDGSDQRVVVPENTRYLLWSFDWSPRGKTIALLVRATSAQEGITYWFTEIPADGGEERPIISPQKEIITGIAWLPDGSGLIMIAADKTTQLQQLWHLAYPSGQVTRITNDSNAYIGVSITSNGETMLANRRTGGGQNIWIGDAGNLNNLRETPVQGDCVKWTPDGKLLYVESEDGKYDLWVMNADATARQRLTNDQSQDEWPVMSPDGRYIAFSSNRSGSPQIWRIDSAGRNLKQLTNGVGGAYWPKITPDGQWVVYATWISPSGWTVRKLPIDGGEQLTVADRGAEFTLSPDGKMVAYQSLDEQKKRAIISVKPMDGSEPARVLDFPDFPIFRIEQWTKDGLLCISASSTQIILFPTNGHRPRQLSDFKTSDRIFSFALSPDGTRVAVSRGISVQEAVMITDFKDR